MSFVETAAQQQLQEAARDVTARVVAPIAARCAPHEKLSPDDLRTISKALAPLVGSPGTELEFAL